MWNAYTYDSVSITDKKWGPGGKSNKCSSWPECKAHFLYSMLAHMKKKSLYKILSTFWSRYLYFCSYFTITVYLEDDLLYLSSLILFVLSYLSDASAISSILEPIPGFWTQRQERIPSNYTISFLVICFPSYCILNCI